MAGVVREIRVQPGSAVRAGQRVVVLELDSSH
jgi:urea carboxylase